MLNNIVGNKYYKLNNEEILAYKLLERTLRYVIR